MPRCSLYMGMLNRFPRVRWALSIVLLSKHQAMLVDHCLRCLVRLYVEAK